MSTIDYSRFDKLEISDDSGEECHPNIDKASWLRWKRQAVHQKREERKAKIASLQQEHKTNEGLKARMLNFIPALTSSNGKEVAEKLLKNVVTYETERKPKIFDEKSDEYLQPKDEGEVFNMLLSRQCAEQGVPATVDGYHAKLPEVFKNEIPKLEKRQEEVLKTIAQEEKEQTKKLTSDMMKEKYSKTVINKNAVTGKAPGGKKESAIEVLNPGYENVQKSSSPTKKKTVPENDVDLRELSLAEEKMMLMFARIESFEESYKYIQANPSIVAREFADHLMARAFRLQMEGKSKDARLCAKWSLALSYSMQMGPDGVGLFYKRLTGPNPEPRNVFENDIEQTYNRIKERAKVLKEKEREVNEENSNLTPEQAVAFKSFPKYFKEALLSNDLEKINEAFAKMGEEKANEVMQKCQEVGLIAVLSEEEAKKIQEEQAKAEEAK